MLIIITIGLWHDLHSPDRAKIISFVLAAGIPMCFWLAAGAVTTDQDGITRKGFLHSRSFRWGDITELRVHTKQGGAIELLAGSKTLMIDFRVVAFQHLLGEIKERTKLQPSKE